MTPAPKHQPQDTTTMALSKSTKMAILRANKHVMAVYDRPQANDPATYVVVHKKRGADKLTLPLIVNPGKVIVREQNPLKTLILFRDFADEACYDEPIPGGIQIQPAGAPWVGTLGAPCGYRSQAGNQRWGILSCWHVLVDSRAARGTNIHQPVDTYPPIAALDDWETVRADKINHMDAAVADAMIDGFHTISPDLLAIGHINPIVYQPALNMEVSKFGRTTEYTQAVCSAIDACVSVSYGSFTADFCDQAIFETVEVPFSEPGDSGSLIVTTEGHHPTALLFAGNDEMTIGCPLPPIVSRFNLSFDFGE